MKCADCNNEGTVTFSLMSNVAACEKCKHKVLIGVKISLLTDIPLSEVLLKIRLCMIEEKAGKHYILR
jgi:DNA-directed RNA polymerase subunit RPC12/RpoP